MERQHLIFSNKIWRKYFLSRTHQTEKFIFLLLLVVVYSHQLAKFFFFFCFILWHFQIGFHEPQAGLKLSVAKDEFELDPLWCITGFHHQTWFYAPTKSHPKPCTEGIKEQPLGINNIWGTTCEMLLVSKLSLQCRCQDFAFGELKGWSTILTVLF